MRDSEAKIIKILGKYPERIIDFEKLKESMEISSRAGGEAAIEALKERAKSTKTIFDSEGNIRITVPVQDAEPTAGELAGGAGEQLGVIPIKDEHLTEEARKLVEDFRNEPGTQKRIQDRRVQGGAWAEAGIKDSVGGVSDWQKKKDKLKEPRTKK